MSLPDLDCLDFSLHSRSPSRSPSPDPDPNTSSTLFPTLRKYLKSPSREIELVRKDQADLLTQVALHEEDELVQEDTLRDLAELDGRSRPLQNRIKTTKFLARIHPNTRLGLHSKIDQCRTKLKNVEQNYKTKSSEASDIREKVEADLLAQGQLQNLTLTASGSTPPRQGAQPNVANIPYASNAGVSRDICTNIHSALNAQREAESRTLSSPSTEITTTTEEERNENRPPSYRPLPSTSERGHGLSTASPQDLSPTHILLPHEVQPTRSAGPSSGYNRPLPNPPAVPSTGTPALPGVDALAVTPGQTRTHSKTVSQSPSATRTTRPAGGRAPTQNHSSHFVESARAQSQQATRPTHSNHVSAGTVPSQSTDHCSSPGHGRESDDRAFHLNPSALSVKASDGHDQASATTSSHVSQRHSSVPAASQPKPSNQRNTPNSSATPIASHRQRSASQALKPSWTQSSMGSQDRRVHDEAVGQSPRDLESGQLSQVPTVPLRQPPLEGLTPAVQVDRRSPSNSSAMPIASPRQRSASQAPQPSSTQSYMRSRDRRVHDEALGQSLRNLESGQLSQGPTIPPRHPPLGSLAPTLRTDNEPETTRPTMRVKLPIAGSEHAALPPTRGIPAACISGPAPQNERPRRITQTTSSTGQSNSRIEAQVKTSTSRTENSASCDPSGRLPRNADLRHTSAQVEPATPGGVPRREMGSKRATLPPTRGAPDADTSNPAPQNERPSRSPHAVPGTGQSNSRREAHAPTSTSRAENSASCARSDPSGLLPRTAESRRTSAQVEPTTQGGVHRREIAGSEHTTLPRTRAVPDACTSDAAPQNEPPRRPLHITSVTGQSDSRREPQVQTLTNRAENSAYCARCASERLPRTAESRHTSAQAEPTTQGGVHRRDTTLSTISSAVTEGSNFTDSSWCSSCSDGTDYTRSTSTTLPSRLHWDVWG